MVNMKEVIVPSVGPQLDTSECEIDNDGYPICQMPNCRKRLRAQFGGYGYNGNGHFCSMRCAAEWADLKVQIMS